MKKNLEFAPIIYFLIFMLSPFFSDGQVDTNFYELRNYFFQGYQGVIDTNEASVINQFQKYEYINGPKFSPTGSIEYAFDQYQDWITDYEQNGDGTTSLTSNWQSIGPNNTPTGSISAKGVGRLICITQDPEHPFDTIFVGSPFGGAWKTYDGGQNWSNLNTDFLPITKCSEIAINPNNNSMIFIATGDRDDYHNASISAGVYRSNDAGSVWTPVNNGLNFNGFFQISKILINPSNPDIAYLSTSQGIFKTTNATTNCQWIQLTDALVYQKYFRNIIYKPDGLNSTLYASGKDIIMSTDGGNTWSSMTGSGTGLDFSTFTDYPFPVRINITVSPAAPNKLFAYASLSNTPAQLQWNSTVKSLVFIFDGSLWSVKNFLPGNYESGYWYTSHGAGPAWMPIAVSPTNADHIYIGNVVSWRTFDGGTNWSKVYDYNQSIHADCHDLKYSPDGQILYVATDGGFSKITNPGSTNSPAVYGLNNGLTIGTITKIALTNREVEFTLIGEFDCGSSKYDPLNYPSSPWETIKGGDGCEQEINLLSSDTVYSSSQKNHIQKFKDRGDDDFYLFSIPFDEECNNWEDAELIADYTLLQTDQSIIYACFSDIYKNEFQSSWVQLSNFTNDFNLNCYDPLTSFDIAPNNPEYIYVAVEHFQDNNPSEYLLFKTTSGGYDNGCTTGCWTELFPPNPHHITGIAVSPYDKNKIWISYSGYDVNDKVKYYNGSTWNDFSNGLPNLPINHILYNYGSDNGLFVATDNGVYYRDANLDQWEPFKTNLPNVSVSELEINYGNSKISAGTYGRGLWESSLPCTLNETELYLDNDQTWKTAMRFDRNVIVGSGSTLTVEKSSIIYFVSEAKLIIQSGGKLILDGGTLTNGCGDIWQGIEVWGNPNATQIPANQGILQVINGGTIENAEVAVRVGSEDYTGKGGGIVYATDASFKNNDVSVWFDPYSYSPSNASYFWYCTFDYDRTITGEANFTFAKLNGVDYVNFEDCDFTNNSSQNHVGIGIESVNSTPVVEGKCTTFQGNDCTAWEYGLFSNLYYAIYATAANATDFADVRHTTFTNNFRGIYLSGMTLPRVTSNWFYLNEMAAEESYGLYLDGSTQYWVEDNTFRKCDECERETGIGIYVNASGAQPNEIYLNAFDGVEYAVITLGVNRTQYKSGVGLVIRCNDYNNTLFDETIIYDGINDPPPANEGISKYQGSYSLNAEDMAGNLFFYNNTVSGDYDDINNESNHFYYYYSNIAGSYHVEPLDYTSSTVTKVPRPIIGWTYEGGCPSNLTTGGGGGTEESRAAMNEAMSDIANTEAVLTALVDGGDTESLKTEVETSTPPETSEIYTELMAESPNLSETVVETSIEKEEVLPNAMIRDIMVANPHTSTSLQLLAKLDDRTNPMPAWMKAQILAGRSIQSLKTELEGQLATHEIAKYRAMNRLARHFGQMSENPAITDSLIALYYSDNTVSSRYMQAWLYLYSGQYQQGQNIMTTIPAIFTLTENELAEYQNMQWLYATLAGLFESGNRLNELNEAQIGQLNAIVADETGVASVYARNILLAIDELEYLEPVILPNSMKSAEAEGIYNETLKTKAPSILEVYPNPSKDFVIIGYQFDTETEGMIEVRDVSGRLMESVPLKGMNNQLTVTTRTWKAGVYMLSLVVNGKVIETTKFTLVK